MGRAYEKTNKRTNIVKGTWQTLFWLSLFVFIFCRVTPACALTFVVYENVIHFLMPSSWREKTNDWYILLLDTSFTHLHSDILLVETRFPVFILKEFHTCDVFSATEVAQLMYMYMYIREHDQARAYVVYSSPVTHACRGDIFCKFYSNIVYSV